MDVKKNRELRDMLEKELKAKRFEHTLGVAYTAANLAMVHEKDIEKAWLAGMLHDCAKCMSYEEQMSICKKAAVELTEIEKADQSPILHAKAGSILADKKYGIKDKEILDAISYHTTGKPGMSDIGMIVFIADYIEPGRNHAENLPIIRKMAFQNLEDTVYKILEDTLSYLEGTDIAIDINAREALNYYRERLKSNKKDCYKKDEV